MSRVSVVACSLSVAVYLMVSVPYAAFGQNRDSSEETSRPVKQQIVTKQANLELILKGTADSPVLTILLRNTGGEPLAVDSELVFFVTIESWGLGDERITPTYHPVPKEESPSRNDVGKRLRVLPPGGAISRMVDLRRGWNELRSARGISLEGGPLLSGYEEVARLPESTRVQKIVVTYGIYGDCWDGFVGLTRLSPVEAGLFLGPIQQSVEIVADAADDQRVHPKSKTEK